MASANPQARTASLNIISGKVILKENGQPIPDLLVVVYDIDSREEASPEHHERNLEGTGISPSAPVIRNVGDRIGSVLTNDKGQWSLTYDDHEFRNLNPSEKRPDLLLTVQAPEDSDSTTGPVILFSSKILRTESAKIEGSIIRITRRQLADASIPVPGETDNKELFEDEMIRIKNEKKHERQRKKELRKIDEEIEQEDEPELAEMKSLFRKALVPSAEILQGLDNFVKPTQTIADTQTIVVDKGIQNINTEILLKDTDPPVPGKGMEISLFFTQAEKDNLDQLYGFTHTDGLRYLDIPADKVEEILARRSGDDGLGSILFSKNPLARFSIENQPLEKKAEELANPATGNGTNGTNGNPNGTSDDELSETVVSPAGMTSTEISVYLKKLLDGKNNGKTEPEKTEGSIRGNQDTIMQNVNDFKLDKSPADNTAFYDFHSLQIAFQHVWQQLLDETLVNLTEKIQKEEENSGKKGYLTNVRDKLGIGIKHPGILQTLAEEHARASAEEIPVEIISVFDISRPEYDALDSKSKNQLHSLAKFILHYESLSSNPGSAHLRTQANSLRDQGERILDNIRVNKPYSTHHLLKELQERLLSKYEFTVFAADKNYHSINFGIMNTFRQKWEPLCYQAGKLVKTIPLSPKEERKFSVKTNITSKTTRKQAVKNNSSLNQEVNTTNRAESEIVAKAQDKSNFNMGVKIEYSHISSEVGFTKEAQKEAAQTRKDFRESVIKAAQEFKEERNLEIDTEQSYSSEYTESGTIVNPNDELSVTYLFYELQRRFRVSEQLHRVMPVVLVAQEVPAPDAITEGWIVAHDWIINRVLLDDSFRSTLQYLAQKNVGDDFAIRELRKNLRQQRALVNSLQVEFSKLQALVENKYANLQSQTNNRIDEEHDKRFYKWWWWWGNQNRPNEPPDPEMAKAMEQAAADDHKHAVEQAEKMALSVQREVNALHHITSEYNSAMREHLDRITQARRLIVHVKENILYYMQAIWSLEPPDQRYMRLYKVPVPYFNAKKRCIVRMKPAEDVFAEFRGDKLKYKGWLHANVERLNGAPEIEQKQMVELADIDNLLGFKGNYMIFPLKKHNPLTELMAQPYIDEAFGAMDPDSISNISLTDYANYIIDLQKTDPVKFESLKPVLQGWLGKLMSDPLRNGDEVIVPTGSLFIEMLPSKHSLLEDFKLQHRAMDVQKAQAEVRKIELENLRYAARLLAEERTDPEIDKQILVNGHGLGPGIDIDPN